VTLPPQAADPCSPTGRRAQPICHRIGARGRLRQRRPRPIARFD